MSIYAVGDIQGCFSSLECLLEQADFDPNSDTLWVAGDLVNRGPQSLQTLRFIYGLGDSAQIVLGNHDLHLLAIGLGYHSPRKKDTFSDILQAPDCEQLLDWLCQQPLIYRNATLPYIMVHAGIPPIWNAEQAFSFANEVETVLRSRDKGLFLQAMYGNAPDCWDFNLQGPDRWRLITNYLTRMRFCSQQGKLELVTKESADTAPEGFSPWFQFPHQLKPNETVLFGHWAALEGKTHHSQFIALDTGCVWGRQLSMLRLDDQQWFRCQC